METNKIKSPYSFSPDDSCIYAVGDIHGRADLLENLHIKIAHDAQKRKSSRKCIIYLGDYIDRGFESFRVIESLINHPMESFEKIFLMGNHEYILTKFLGNHEILRTWSNWGGEATLQSYGIGLRDEKGIKIENKLLHEKFLANLPGSHLDFINNLKLFHTEGDYIFVHAGLKPGITLAEQEAEDMLMIREKFINSDYQFEKTVIFGHTIFESPLIDNNKIGIDTGAYATGRLTALVLDRNEIEFLST